MKPESKSEIILYQTEDNRTRIEVRLEDETVWLSLNQLAELFQRDKSVISKHISNIFEEGELQPDATVAKYATVQIEGARSVNREAELSSQGILDNCRRQEELPNYRTSFYSLDVTSGKRNN